MGILVRLVNHRRLDFVQTVKAVNLAVTIIVTCKRNTLFEQVALLAHDFTDAVHVLRGYCRHYCSDIAERTLVVSITFPLNIFNFWSRPADFRIRDAIIA